MPVPSSARWVSRGSKVQWKSRFSIASGGIPRSRRVVSRMRLTVGNAFTPARTCLGMALVTLGSTRMANCGAWAALANSLSVSPTVWASGLTRWKVSPGSSSSER